MKKVSHNLWLNQSTGIKIEYICDDFCKAYVVYNNEGFIIWDFEDLKSAKICAIDYANEINTTN